MLGIMWFPFAWWRELSPVSVGKWCLSPGCGFPLGNPLNIFEKLNTWGSLTLCVGCSFEQRCTLSWHSRCLHLGAASCLPGAAFKAIGACSCAPSHPLP